MTRYVVPFCQWRFRVSDKQESRQVHGSQFVAKVLGSNAIDPAKRPEYCAAVRKVLSDRNLVNVPAYRRLVEEVGLGAPSGQTSDPPRVSSPPVMGSFPSPGFSGHNPSAGRGGPWQRPGEGLSGIMSPPLSNEAVQNHPGLAPPWAQLGAPSHLNSVSPVSFMPVARPQQQQQQHLHPSPTNHGYGEPAPFHRQASPAGPPAFYNHR